MSKDTKDKFFSELMEMSYDRIYIFVNRGCSDREFVEDVVQETFLEAYRKVDTLMAHPNTIGWLYNTAKNKKMKLGIMRDKYYRRNEEYEVLNEMEADEEDFEEVELAETIKMTVSEKDYDMLCDYYLSGHSSGEIADKYGIERGSIRMKINRLKKKLKEEILVGWFIFIACIWRFL